jgi:hypothetical protein
MTNSATWLMQLENILFDVMRHARQRQESLLAGKPGLVIAK